MMAVSDKRISGACALKNVDSDYRYYCKLFDDMITRTPCLLRRKELNGAELSCVGCSKDTIMNSLHNRRREMEQS